MPLGFCDQRSESFMDNCGKLWQLTLESFNPIISCILNTTLILTLDAYVGLKGNDPHRFIGSGTLKRCGLVGGCVIYSFPAVCIFSYRTLSSSSAMSACLSASMSRHNDNRLYLWTVSQPPVFSFIRVAMLIVSLHSNDAQNKDNAFLPSVNVMMVNVINCRIAWEIKPCKDWCYAVLFSHGGSLKTYFLLLSSPLQSQTHSLSVNS